MSKFQASNKNNPCPVCGRTKDGDCRISQDGGLAMCHTEINGRQPKEEFKGFIYLGEDATGNWGKWRAKSDKFEKQRTPGEEFRYPFTDIEGTVLVEEVRVYQSNGTKKTWMEPKGVDTSKLVPYRYSEAIQSLEDGADNCVICEGPPKADALWKLGIPAVAFANGFKSSRDSNWFEGYEDRLIVAADRDKPGLQKAEKVLKAYPLSKLLKPCPDSVYWEPEFIAHGGGFDVSDWIDQMKREGLDSDQIKAELWAAIETVPSESQPPEDVEDIEDDSRPTIQLNAGRLTRNLDQIEVELAKTIDQIYVQGGQDGYYLVRVLRAVPDRRKHLIEVSPDSDSLDMLTVESLQYELNKRFRFERWDSRKEDYKSCDCPRSIASQFLQKGAWQHLPRLTGISHIPLLCRDGQVITTPGYHGESGMLLQFKPDDFPAIPDQCNRRHAEASLEMLRDWLKEFPFQKNEHESVAISEVLTAVSRRILRQAPLFATSATKAGSGKGTKAKGTAILLMGGHPGTIPYTGESEEFRKKITSFLKTGQPLGLVDNVTGLLGGDVLEQILTEPFFKDRLLGGNQMPKFSTQVLLLANGNNLRFRPDMTRRTMLCVLDPEMEKPETREFERDFEKYTHENRGELVTACLTILKAYIQAGYPSKLKPLGSFGDWSNLVRSSLVWLGMADPLLTQDEIREQDDHRITLQAFLQAWEDSYPPSVLGRPAQKTAREICLDATHKGSGDMRDILLEVALDRSGELSPRKLSYFLRGNHRSVVGNLRLESNGKDRLGYALWSVMTVHPDRRGTSSASSAESAKPTENQCFQGAEDQNLSSAGQNPSISNGFKDSAEDAEDKSRRSELFVNTGVDW